MIDLRIRNFFTSLPILDPNYPYNNLLSAVNAIRKHRAEKEDLLNEPGELFELMQPDRAIEVSCKLLDYAQPPHGKVSLQDQIKIDKAINNLKHDFPQWSLPLSLNVSYLKLPDGYGAISGSAQKWPQHILLSGEAMEPNEIEEQLIHEFCHQWQYLIQEIMPTNKYSNDRTLTLPSGTMERAPSEVLGAGHVAATLIEYYRVKDPKQISSLVDYAVGCDKILTENTDRLSETGIYLAFSLKSWIERNV